MEIYRNVEFYIFSATSPLASGSILDYKLLCAMLPAWMAPTHALFNQFVQQISKFLAWNLRHMRKGVGPDVGFADEPLHGYHKEASGKTLAGGWKATFFGSTLKGKWMITL